MNIVLQEVKEWKKTGMGPSRAVGLDTGVLPSPTDGLSCTQQSKGTPAPLTVTQGGERGALQLYVRVHRPPTQQLHKWSKH